MALEIIEHYYIGVMISTFLLFFIRQKNRFSKEINNYFVASALCAFFLPFFDAVETVLSMQKEPSIWRIAVSCAGYILRPAVAYFILLMAIRDASRRVKWLVSLPLIFEVIVCCSAFFGDIAFGYNAANEFYRGPLGHTPFFVGGLYGTMIVAATFWLVRKSLWEEGFFITAVAMVNVAGTVLESVYELDGVLSASIALSLAFYYLFFHTYQNDRDILTGMLLRRKFYQDAERWGSSVTGLISIDMNGLKEINDLYGHREGDRAIAALAVQVSGVLPPRATFYRIGGDEFMIICRKMSEEEVSDLVRKIREQLEARAYSCAIGYAMCAGAEQFEEACHQADERMYADKLRMKGVLPGEASR